MSNLVMQYQNSLNIYQQVTRQFQSVLSMLLQNQEVPVHSITGRAKDIRSLAGKIHKNKNKYKKLQDITDLCGLRIITYYEDDVDRVAALIRDHFSIDEENSVDKRQTLKPTEFGYASLHLIVNLPAEADKPQAAGCCKVEIQIRSLLQHAWAEIEHDLEYKNPAGTTPEIRRRFSRVASLLESADIEFRALRAELTTTGSAEPAVQKTAPKAVFRLPQSRIGKFLDEFPNYGWAACAALVFLLCSILVDHYTGTKFTEMSLVVSSMMLLG